MDPNMNIHLLSYFLITRVNADVLDEPCRSSGSVVAVATLQLSVVCPLEAIHQHVGPVLQRNVHWRMVHSIVSQIWPSHTNTNYS